MSAAWFIEAQRARRVLLAVICPPDIEVSLAWSKNFTQILATLPSGSSPAWIPGLPYDMARNAGVAEALAGGYGYLAFLDSDTLPERPDAFNVLMATGLPLVAGIYRKRFPPFPLAAYNLGADKEGKPAAVPLADPIPWGQIAPVDCIPTGLMLIRRDLLATAVARWAKPFDWTMNPLHPEIYGTSEDYNFTLKCKTELGVQPFIHFGVTAQHEVRARLNPQDGTADFSLFKADGTPVIQQAPRRG